MKKLPAQQVCDILNSMTGSDDGFVDSLRLRVSVSGELAINSSVNCGVIDGGYDSSPLGFINALTDETIGFAENKDSPIPVKFAPLSELKREGDAMWSKYEQKLLRYNKEHGANHQPEKRVY